MIAVASAGRRRLLLVTGAEADCERRVLTAVPASILDDTLWVAGSAPSPVRATASTQVVRRLGGECRLLVFNAHQGFHPDAFAAAVGTLRGGGDCVVLAPPKDAWAGFADPDAARFASYPRCAADMDRLYLRRLVDCWSGDPGCFEAPADGPLEPCWAAADPTVFQLSDAQLRLCADVASVAHGHARRPLLIAADRGRGKSTLLGVAAAQLLQRGLSRITVVAAYRAAAATLFRHAAREAGLAPSGDADLPIADGVLCFRRPADLIVSRRRIDGLVIVDEAAAIPVALLAQLMRRCNRLVLASTEHGYEGSGRGFTLRFRALLDEVAPRWVQRTLAEPMRWASDDPLEALVNRSLLLDADCGALGPDSAPTVIERVERAALGGDEALLREVFALLVSAHYRTRPSDLRNLLDNRDLVLWLARDADVVVGVMVAVREGAIDPTMAGSILAGRRRPRGHMLVQSLAVQSGLDDCLQMRLLRVQRIAIHPDRRRRGVGSELLAQAAQWAGANGFDLLGCAYGADPSLLAFWRRNGFRSVRLGLRVDPASGLCTLFMLRGLSNAGHALGVCAARQFEEALPWQLAGGAHGLDTQLALRLLRGRDCSDVQPRSEQLTALARIAGGARPVASADALLWKWTIVAAAQGHLPDLALAPVLAWRVQHRTVDDVCDTFALGGRKALEQRLRSLLSESLPLLHRDG